MTSRVIFQFDKEKDLENIWRTCNVKPSYGHNWRDAVTPNIFKICHKKNYQTSKNELIKTMKYIHNSPISKPIVNSFNDAWKIIEKEFFRKLENVTKRKIKFKKVNAYLTTTWRCPYNPHGEVLHFFVNFFANVPHALKTAAHELMHMHIHNTDYWTKIENEVGDNKTHDLKEALTELLNLEFNDLLIVNDEGYPTHKILRRFISKEWKKEKNFEKLINNSIKWIKKNGVK